MTLGPIAECPWCHADTMQARNPVVVYCTTCGSLWEFPTRADPGVATTPAWAKDHARLEDENREWVRLARAVKNAAGDAQFRSAVHELTECALGNGYLDLAAPLLKIVMDERERLAEEVDALRRALAGHEPEGPS